MKNSLSRIIRATLLLSFLLPAAACSDKDEPSPAGPLPVVTFPDYAGGVYGVKIGKSLNITPVIIDAENPSYAWVIDGKVVSTELSYTFTAASAGTYYLTFRLFSNNGDVQEEIKVMVMEKMPPVVSLPVDDKGVIALWVGREMEVTPQVKYAEGAVYAWTLDDNPVGTAKTYTLKATEPAERKLVLTVTNEDGQTRAEATVRMTEAPNIVAAFASETIAVPSGRSICLSPCVDYATAATVYRWEVDGQPQTAADKPYFAFTPTETAGHTVTVSATENGKTASASVKVIVGPAEGTYRRTPVASSSARETTVFEYLPAPGQFVNDGHSAATLPQANAYALGKLKSGTALSLGGFGGYIVVGFDHSIANAAGKKDFAVAGNSFKGSSEAGIVWVMQDENGDGLPNDTWYELKGSETGKPETIQQYAVTYFRPAASKMNVVWRDNQGQSGHIDYLGQYHGQDSYYPAWASADSYTLRGTCLKARNYDESGNSVNWINPEYDWGYADNAGSDTTPGDGTASLSGNHNYFDIANAVCPDGQPADLQYIDFIKVQCAVNAKSGWQGELSTEVCGFTDLHVNR